MKQMLNPEVEDLPKLGPYVLRRQIRCDGTSTHYLARNEQHPESVLIRVFHPEIVNSENFLVRFELLRPLVSSIRHRNVIDIRELNTQDNLYYMVAERPAGEDGHVHPNLLEYCERATENRMLRMEKLFGGVVDGLIYLAQLRNSYYREGLLHPTLNPDGIYVAEEKAAIGGALNPVPKISGFIDSFLCFGDSPHASMQRRLSDAVAKQKESAEIQGLYTREWLYPPEARRRQDGTPVARPSYALAQLIYKVLGRQSARGIYAKLKEIDPQLDPLWDEIATLGLHSGEQSEEERLLAMRELFTQIATKRIALSPKEEKLRALQVPPGMALISFDTKVELGAPDGPPEEQPNFKARLKPFLIDIAPVTVSQMYRFLPNYRPSTYSQQDQHPATLISWAMAKAYCDWRSRQEGLPEGTYRLPTEYEWEAAARGAGGHQYPWGPAPDSRRCHCEKSNDFGAVKVGSFPPGRFGLYDMLGNVWEWTESIFKPHPYSEDHDRRYERDLRTIKGGCWSTGYRGLRASLRDGFAAEERAGHIGFRCVREITLDEDNA